MPRTAEKQEFLRQVASEAPEYREILGLFEELYRSIEGQERETGIVFAPAASRVAQGVPLVGPERLRVDEGQAARFLNRVVQALIRAGKEGEADLTRLSRAVESGRVQLAPLFAACLSRDGETLAAKAGELGVPGALLEFVLEPVLKTALEGFAESVDAEEFAGWQQACCPICGTPAGMGELAGDEGKRQLSCSTCLCKWPYPRLKCPYCGNDDPESLTYFSAGEGPTRVDVCRKCNRYLKTRDARRGRGEVPLDAEDLATLHLDLVARKEGYSRGG